MKAAVITMVHDYLGYGYFSGKVVQGFCACIRCMDNTTYRQLPKDPGSSKTVFQGSRRWLPKKHAWRKHGHLFDGSEELREPQARRSGKEIDNLLKTWKECPAPGKKKKKTQPLMRVWKTKSVFWDLEYWSLLLSPHSLDIMHITKNVCERLFGTLLNMPEKTKDGPKASKDLKFMGIRRELHPPSDDDDEPEEEEDMETQNSTHRKRKRVTKKKAGTNHCPMACFTLSEEEIKQFIQCLLGVKFPNGYTGKISRYLDEAKQHFSRMKSHDCAMLMTQILPVAIRGIMDEHVRKTLFGLCNFFDVISRKSICAMQLKRLKEEIVLILCELEIYFPPAFFDIMVHLLIHVVEDIVQLGPAFLRSMMPFERMNAHIKKIRS